jgi:hypothetical protein
MTAPYELLIDGLVACAAIGRGGAAGVDDKAMVVLGLLACCDLMAVQAVEALARVNAHLKLMDDRILGIKVAFRALASGPHKGRAGLLEFGAWPTGMNQISGNNQCGGDNDGNEDGSKAHERSFEGLGRIVNEVFGGRARSSGSEARPKQNRKGRRTMRAAQIPICGLTHA